MIKSVEQEFLNNINFDLITHDLLRSDLKCKNLNIAAFMAANGKVMPAPETWEIMFSTADENEGDFAEYLYDSEQEYEADLESLGFYKRDYIIFGGQPSQEYYNGAGIESVSLTIEDGEVRINDGVLHVFDHDKDTIDQLLCEADGWGGFVSLNLAEYRSLKKRMQDLENQVAQ